MTRFVAILAACALLALAPFGAALEVHHFLGAADADGHQHSDSDLCQWVQAHAGSSVLAVVPTLTRSLTVVFEPWAATPLHYASAPRPNAPPRGPPVA